MTAQTGGGQMRTGPGARDPQFRGIDPPALDRVIRQLQDAQTAIQGWLNGHRPPPGVSTAGYRQADEVARWAAEQLDMLTRRYNYAMTHPSPGGEMDAPPAPVAAPAPGSAGGAAPEPPKTVDPPPRRPSHRTTPRGAGDIGNFPDRRTAARAAKADALAVVASVQDGRPVPDPVWRRLKANADDPDYTGTLYERLGPAGAAELLRAAHGDAAKVKAVQEALGVSSHHLTMDAKWLRAFLAEADRAGVRPVAVQVLAGAELSPRARDALGRLGVRPSTADVA